MNQWYVYMAEGSTSPTGHRQYDLVAIMPAAHKPKKNSAWRKFIWKKGPACTKSEAADYLAGGKTRKKTHSLDTTKVSMEDINSGVIATIAGSRDFIKRVDLAND